MVYTCTGICLRSTSSSEFRKVIQPKIHPTKWTTRSSKMWPMKLENVTHEARKFVLYAKPLIWYILQHNFYSPLFTTQCALMRYKQGTCSLSTAWESLTCILVISEPRNSNRFLEPWRARLGFKTCTAPPPRSGFESDSIATISARINKLYKFHNN